MKTKKLLTGLVALVATGAIGVGIIGNSTPPYKPNTSTKPSTAQKENPPDSQPTSSGVTETVYFHFKAPDAIENLYLIDPNGKVLSRIIENGKDLVDIKTRRSMSGGNYNQMYYDFFILEGRGAVEIPYIPKSSKRLSIKIRGEKPYIESIELDANSNERLMKRMENSIKNWFDK